MDQDARELRPATVEVVKELKQTSARQADHMMNERFVTVYRDLKTDKLWEICYRCAGLIHKNKEDYYVDTWTVTTRTGKDGQPKTDRRPLQYKSHWRNISFQSKYAETPASAVGSMKRMIGKAVAYLEQRAIKRAHDDLTEET